MIEKDEARFDAVAADYEKNAAPVLYNFAADLIELVALQPGEKVLDVGTGTGLAALLAAQKVVPAGSVVGIDVSEAMVTIARQKAAKEDSIATFIRGDAEALDFPDGIFDVVISNLGLGSTDPDKSLPSIKRVLTPGARVAFTHWGPTGRAAKAFYDLMQKRRVAEPTSRLAWLRRTDLIVRPWETQYYNPSALAELLRRHGFENIQTGTREYRTSFANSDAYLDMSLVFPLAHAEFEALSPGNQRMFRHEFNAAMAPFRGPNRTIISEDTILFATAIA